MALSSSKSYTMNLRDIYSWVETNFEYFKTAKSGWKNSIRHNLSLQKSFTRVDFAGSNSNQPSVWRLKIDENRKPLTYDSVKEREGKITSTPLKSRRNLNASFGEKFSPVKGVPTPNRVHDSGNFSFSQKEAPNNKRKTIHSLLRQDFLKENFNFLKISGWFKKSSSRPSTFRSCLGREFKLKQQLLARQVHWSRRYATTQPLQMDTQQ